MLIYETDDEYILEHENIRIIADKKQCGEDYVSYLTAELDKVLQSQKNAKNFVRLEDGEVVEVTEPPQPRLTEYSKWQIIREKRNQLLVESDWTQMPDVPLTAEQRQAWRKYRQELRDLPQTFRKADEVVWPIPPK